MSILNIITQYIAELQENYTTCLNGYSKWHDPIVEALRTRVSESLMAISSILLDSVSTEIYGQILPSLIKLQQLQMAIMNHLQNLFHHYYNLITTQPMIIDEVQVQWMRSEQGTTLHPIDKKYGNVESVQHDTDFKNLDYRDTIAPLWTTLYNELDSLINTNKPANTTSEYVQRELYRRKLSHKDSHHQAQVNIALCAAIIQIGNSIRHNNS
jgi:hypothetical protein